jgi:integrase
MEPQHTPTISAHYTEPNSDIPDWQSQYDAFVQAGTAASTRRAYVRDVRYFWAWAELALVQPERYPVSTDTVIRFVLDHLTNMSPALTQTLVESGLRKHGRALKITTLRRYLGSLSIAHQEAGFATPTQSQSVKLLLKRARRARVTERPVKKAAITRGILEAMLKTCDDSLRGVRDRAILSVGFAAGGRRRSELAGLQVENLESIEMGYLLHLDKSKTDQDGEGLTVPVLGSAAHALRAWLVRSGLRSGTLFCGIWNDDSFTDGIKGQTINYIVKQRIKLAGLDPKDFGAHSLRAGFITEAARSGANLSDAMALSGHRCTEVASDYYREATVLKNPAGKLMSD